MTIQYKTPTLNLSMLLDLIGMETPLGKITDIHVVLCGRFWSVTLSVE